MVGLPRLVARRHRAAQIHIPTPPGLLPVGPRRPLRRGELTGERGLQRTQRDRLGPGPSRHQMLGNRQTRNLSGPLDDRAAPYLSLRFFTATLGPELPAERYYTR